VVDKARERSFVEMVSTRLAWRAQSIVPRESPDFALVLPDEGVVGLEVEETVDHGTAAGNAAMNRLCSDLKTTLTARRLAVSVMPSFYWACSELVAPAKVRRAHVKKLADLIEQRPPPTDGKRVTFNQEELTAAGAPFVDHMHVWASDETIVGWGHHRPGPNMPFLDDKIRQKDERLDDYRRNMPDAKEFWLLLVAGAHDASGILHFVAIDYTYQTRFDRVFYLDLQKDNAFAMRVSPRPE
jgi:hypothetical protein